MLRRDSKEELGLLQDDEFTQLELESLKVNTKEEDTTDSTIDVDSHENWRIKVFKQEKEDEQNCFLGWEGFATGLFTSAAFVISIATVPSVISSQAAIDILGKIAWVVAPPALTLLTGITCGFFHHKHLREKAIAEQNAFMATLENDSRNLKINIL